MSDKNMSAREREAMYEKKYCAMFADIMKTMNDVRQVIDRTEEAITNLFGGKHADTCKQLKQDSRALQDSEVGPTLLRGAGNKLHIQLQLLSAYHIMRWHHDEIDVFEFTLVSAIIKTNEATMSLVADIKEMLGDDDHSATHAHDTVKDVLSSLKDKFGDFGRFDSGSDQEPN